MSEEVPIHKPGTPFVLITMSGIGVAPPGPGNAVSTANTPNLDELWPRYPHGTLEASGVYIGMPENTPGNSELGHLTIGAGKVIMQHKRRIDQSIADGTFQQNPKLIAAMEHVKKHESSLHLMGLIGQGDVVSSRAHLEELIIMAKKRGVNPDKVFIHAFTDGIDTPGKEAINILEDLENFCISKRIGKIATIVGRRFAMDVEKKWEHIQVTYKLLTQGKGRIVSDWRRALSDAYEKGLTDDMMTPLYIAYKDDAESHTMQKNDAVIFFNYDKKTSLELARAFEDDIFTYWERDQIENLYFLAFTDYAERYPLHRAFPIEQVEITVSSVLSEYKKNQLKIAETPHFPYVTYYFNGGSGAVHEGERWIEIPADSEQDQLLRIDNSIVMKKTLDFIKNNEIDFYLVNFCSAALLAATGDIDATVHAIELIDDHIGMIVGEVLSLEGTAIITSEFSLAEEIVNVLTGERKSDGTANEVPLLIINASLDDRELPVSTLADLAPTILQLMGIPIPPEMQGKNLL